MSAAKRTGALTAPHRRCGAAAAADAAAGTCGECLFDPLTACWRIAAEFRGMVGNQLPHGAKPGGKPQDVGTQAAAGAHFDLVK